MYIVPPRSLGIKITDEVREIEKQLDTKVTDIELSAEGLDALWRNLCGCRSEMLLTVTPPRKGAIVWGLKVHLTNREWPNGFRIIPSVEAATYNAPPGARYTPHYRFLAQIVEDCISFEEVTGKWPEFVAFTPSGRDYLWGALCGDNVETFVRLPRIEDGQELWGFKVCLTDEELLKGYRIIS